MDSAARESSDWEVNDLKMILQGALATNFHLFGDREIGYIQTILALPRESFASYARLSGWSRSVFILPCNRGGGHVSEDDIAELLGHGLLLELLPSPTRCRAFSSEALRSHLRAQGLSGQGNKEALVTRAFERSPTIPGRVFMLPHRTLMQRCEWLFFGGRKNGRKKLLLARLGRVSFKSYRTSPSRPLFVDRAAMLSFLETARADRFSDSELVMKIASLPASPKGQPWLSTRGSYGRALVSRAETAQKNKEHLRARTLFEAARRLEVGVYSDLVRKEALSLEALGRKAAAAQICMDARAPRNSPYDIALHRTGRRLCRAAGKVWVPDVPLRTAAPRQVFFPADLPSGAVGSRVEAQAGALLAPRHWVHGEGGFWTTLFCILFYDLLWEPVPGMLPAPCLAGPLDLGTSQFVTRRSRSYRKRIDALQTAAAWKDIAGVYQDHGARVRGLQWNLCTVDQWRSFLRTFPRGALLAIMDEIAKKGFAGAAGLPDLVVWDGEAVRHGALFPTRIAPGPFLVEIKTPNDGLSDGQRWWHHRLLSLGIRVELWTTKTVHSGHENHRRTFQGAATAPPKRRSSPTDVRPGSRGTLFDLGPKP